MPQVAYDQLDAHLARGMVSLYVVHGDEPLLSLETVDRLRAKARAEGATERQVLQFEARSDWSQLTAQSATMSLFAEKRLLEIRLPTGKPGVQGAAALERFASAPDDSQIAIVLLPKLDKTGKSSAWFMALASNGVSIEVPSIERAQLPRWIGERLARNKQSAGNDALEFIADKVEGNLLAAHQEISKLALLYPAGALSLAQVEDAVLNVARYGIGQLSEALLAGDLARCMRIADGLKAEGEGLPLVVWAVGSDVESVLRFKQATAAGRHPSTLKNELRLWGAREGQVTQAARRLSTPALLRATAQLADVDRLAKGLAGRLGKTDPWEALGHVFAACCIKPQSRAQ
ncbi:MAG: DNA polymerase III subunit delta [Burkholderiaceae bacterium]